MGGGGGGGFNEMLTKFNKAINIDWKKIFIYWVFLYKNIIIVMWIYIYGNIQ